jgi:hypothetical protein
MKQQTAVEWLAETLKFSNKEIYAQTYFIIEQAKEMEKNNICDAWDNGYDKGARDRIEKISNPVGNAEQYYKQTYKSE